MGYGRALGCIYLNKCKQLNENAYYYHKRSYILEIKHKMKYLIISILFAFSICASAQSFNIDASIATDPENSIMIYNFSSGAGYSFTNNDYFFGGIKFQSYSLIPKSKRDENDLWSTTNVLNFMFYGGIRYNIPLIRINKNSESEHILGFFPEYRLYFNPYVPRKIKYIDENNAEVTSSGDYATQFAHGIGFGIYIKEKENNASFALRFEYSNIDAFQTLRELDYGTKHFDFPSNTQYSIGISLFFL